MERVSKTYRSGGKVYVCIYTYIHVRECQERTVLVAKCMYVYMYTYMTRVSKTYSSGGKLERAVSTYSVVRRAFIQPTAQSPKLNCESDTPTRY